MKITRWMMNTRTHVVFPYNEKQIEDENNRHLTECTKDGIPVAAKQKAENTEKPADPKPEPEPAPEPEPVTAKETPVEILPEEPQEPVDMKNVKMPDVPLEECPRAELRGIANAMKINVSSKARVDEIITLIRAKQAAAAEAAVESE